MHRHDLKVMDSNPSRTVLGGCRTSALVILKPRVSVVIASVYLRAREVKSLQTSKIMWQYISIYK